MYMDLPKLQSAELQKLWLQINENKTAYILSNYKTTHLGILSHFRRTFGVAPVTLRTKTSERAKYLYPLALYLLANNTEGEKSIIADDFGVTPDELLSFCNNASIKIKYRFELKEFFDPLMSPFFHNLYANLVLTETLRSLPHEVLMDLANAFPASL